MPMQWSGAVSMSQLRAEFKDTTSGSVSMSELRKGGSFVSDREFVDPSNTIKRTTSDMSMSNYYGTTKARQVVLAWGFDPEIIYPDNSNFCRTETQGLDDGIKEFVIPANCRRIIINVTAGGGGGGRYDGGSFRYAVGGGGGGSIRTLGWQNLPENYAGSAKVLAVGGGGGGGGWQKSGARGRRSEALLLGPGDNASIDMSDRGRTLYSSGTTIAGTVDPTTANYRMWLVAEGGEGGRTSATVAEGGQGGRAEFIHKGIPGVTSVGKQTATDVISNIRTLRTNPWPNDPNLNPVYGMEGGVRSHASVCVGDFKDDPFCDCRTAYGGEPGHEFYSFIEWLAVGGRAGGTSAYVADITTCFAVSHSCRVDGGEGGGVVVIY